MKISDAIDVPKMVPSEPSGVLFDDNTYLGIEVETEASKLQSSDLDLKWWRMIQDGSLKSPWPWEFVFAQPLAGKQVHLALIELEELLEDTPVEYPFNTGVHVHMNIGDLTDRELRNLCYLSIVLESALLNLSGGKRDNCFCIPWSHVSPTAVQAIGHFLDNPSPGYCTEDLPKYMTVNFRSIFTLGTIEYRTHTGTHSYKDIMRWIDILLRLKHAAVNMQLDPREALDYQQSEKGLKQFLLDIWPPEYVNAALKPGLHEDMLQSSLAARSILFPKQWNEIRNWIRGEETGLRDDMESILKAFKTYGIDEPDWAMTS